MLYSSCLDCVDPLLKLLVLVFAMHLLSIGLKHHFSLLAACVASCALVCNAQIKTCGKVFGHPMTEIPCEAALSNLPQGNLPSIFTTREKADTNNYNQVPIRYFDAADNPSCTITVDLDGHSKNDVFVLVPWNQIRSIAAQIIERCVGRFQKGGIQIHGLEQTFEGLIPFTPYDPVTAAPAQVVNPDGLVDPTSVAIPVDYEDGISKSPIPRSIIAIPQFVRLDTANIITVYQRDTSSAFSG